MKKIGYFFLGVSGAFVLFSSSFVASAAPYPSPQGYVTDNAQMLSADERTGLDSSLNTFKEQTGNEIAILTVPSLAGEPIEDYAVKVFEQWGIGQKEKDNGILILISRDDREVRIEVGYGLESIINDAKAGKIIRNIITPAFQKGEYHKGLVMAVALIQEEVILGSNGGNNSGDTMNIESGLRAFEGLAPIFGFLLVYLSSFLARSKRWWPGGVLGVLVGAGIGYFVGSALLLGFGFGGVGLVFDYVVSKNYRERSRKGLPTDFWRSGGGFFGGGGFGGGGSSFGGFGGGSSGGGGASGRW